MEEVSDKFRPTCKQCANIVPRKSYCLVLFSHARRSEGIEHLFWYCPVCKIRAGTPIPMLHLKTFKVKSLGVPVIDIRDREDIPKTKTTKQYRDEWKTKKDEEAQRLRKLPYKEYLQTNHWKLLKAKVTRRAKNRCQLCNTLGYLQVHHRTYERRGCEYLKDLIALCDGCHAKFHDKLPKGEDG